jgi:opacity protein-like surface antigen
MKKVLALMVVVLAAGSGSVPGFAAEYDRYERGYRSDYPPPRAEMPRQRHARQGEPYVFAHLGVYDPNDATDGLKGYDAGLNAELGIGSRISPIFAVDGTLGVYGAERGPDEATVVPVTIGARFIVPNPFIEPYLGAGLGLYFSSLKEEARVGPPAFSGIDDSSTDFGGYLSLGADFWLNERLALNAEGKYHWVQPTFRSGAGNDFDVDLGGWIVNLGVRFAF